MLSDPVKVAVRRFCGYPAFGSDDAGNLGWRFFTAYGALEYRMNNLTSDEEAVVLTYVATLTELEGGIPVAAETLNSDAAASWTRNTNEIQDRLRLFDAWRRRLCGFLGVPPGEALGPGGVGLIV
jgi:hypothetical protein